MSTYEVHAFDIVTGLRVLVNVPFTSFRWAETINDQPLRDSQKRPGFRGVLAPDDSASLASLTPGQTLLVVEDTVVGAPIYVGIVWTWTFNPTQHGFDVDGESVWSYWRRRLIVGADGMSNTITDAAEGVVQFDTVEQFDIVADLVAHAVATGEGADFRFADVRYRPADITSGATQSTAWDRSQFRSVAAAVEEVARQDDGFDFVFSYGWDTGTAPPYPLLVHLDLWYPRFGSAYATTLTDGDNVTVIALDRPAHEMANPLAVVEIVDGPAAYIATVDDPNRADLGGDLPYLDGVFVTREHGRDGSGLEALAITRMLYTRGPVYNGQIEMGGAVELSAIEPGDTVDLVATVSGLDVTETERVFGKRVLTTAGELDTWSLDLVDENASVGVPRGTGDVELVSAVLVSAATGLPVGFPADMSAWWDFSDTSTITDAGSGAVSEVADKSTYGRVLTQGTAANRPTTGTRTINGLNVLDFDGADDRMATASFTLAQPCTVFAVVSGDDTVHSGADSDVPYGSADALFSPFYIGVTDVWQAWAGTTVITSSAPVDTDPHLVTSKMNGASSVLYLDGVSVATGDVGANPLGGGWTVGAQSDTPTYVWDGAVGEILIYSSALSDADRLVVEAWLLDKWGL